MNGEMNGAVCTFCGQPITGDLPEQANPCEYCNSLDGGYPHMVDLTAAISGAAVEFVEGATYPRILLGMASSLLAKNEEKLWGLVTILAHLACEVAVERSLSDSFARKGIRSLEDPVADALNGYNVANDKVLNFYISLTGDDLRERSFWGAFLRSAKRRDNIIRRGLVVGRPDAEESVKAAAVFIEHLTGHSAE